MILYQILQKFYLEKNQQGPHFNLFLEKLFDNDYECWINIDSIYFSYKDDAIEVVEKVKKKVKHAEFIIREIEAN